MIHNPPDKDTQPRDAVFPAEMLGISVDEDIVTQVRNGTLKLPVKVARAVSSLSFTFT